MTHLQDTVRRGQARWNRALALGLAARGVGFGLLAGGCAILIGRVSGYAIDLPAAGLGLVGGLVWAASQYRSRKVSEQQVLTLLDLKGGGRGELLFAFETGRDAELRDSITRPRPAWRKSVAPALLPGLLFFAVTLFVPVRALAQNALDPIAEARLEELEQLAATLEETLELEEEFKEEIEQNLETLKGSGEEPRPTGEAMREALDALEQRLEQAAEAAASELEDVVRDASESAQGSASEDPTVRDQAFEELQDMLQEGQDSGLLPENELSEKMLEQLSALPELSKEAMEALSKLAEAGKLGEMSEKLAEMGLSPEDLAKIAQALAEGLSQEALEKLAELAQKGLLKPSGSMGELGEFDPKALEEYLKRLQELQPGGT